MEQKPKRKTRKWVVKNKRLHLIVTAAIALMLLLLTPIVIWFSNNYTVEIREYQITNQKIPSGFSGYKIVLLSDLHDRAYGKNNKTLIRKVKKQNPDLILMCGDMINWNTSDFTTVTALSSALCEICEVYYVYGNHEQSCFNVENALQIQYEEQLTAVGVKIINEQKVTIEIGGNTINLYGITQELYYYSGIDENGNLPYVYTKEDAIDAIGEADNGFNIMLTHNPIFFDSYSEWGADLILCGHMHGGVITIPFYGGLLSPNNEIFPEYAQGRFVKATSTMIVSRGLGEHAGRYRFLNPQEIVVITLNNE